MNNISRIDYQYLLGAVPHDGPENEYTGSLPAKDGTKGVFANIFRYRLWLKKDTETKAVTAINAACYFGCNCYDKTDPAIMMKEQFPASEEGAEQACNWVQACYDKA